MDYEKLIRELVDKKAEQDNQLREAAEKEFKCCDNQEMTDQKFEVQLNDKDGTCIDVNVDFCKNCGLSKDVWKWG